MSSGLVSGIDGTYQSAAASAVRVSPAAYSTMSATRPLHDPHPLPARVFAHTSPTLVQPDATQPMMSPLVTPLQLQT